MSYTFTGIQEAKPAGNYIEMPHEICMICGFKSYPPSHYALLKNGIVYQATKVIHHCPDTEYEWLEIPESVAAK